MRRPSIRLTCLFAMQAILAAGASAEPAPRFHAEMSAPSCGGDAEFREASLDDLLIIREVGDCAATFDRQHACRTPAAFPVEATSLKQAMMCWPERRTKG